MRTKFVRVSGFAALCSSIAVATPPKLQRSQAKKNHVQKPPPEKPVPVTRQKDRVVTRFVEPQLLEPTPDQIARVARILELPQPDTTVAPIGPKRDALQFEHDRFALRYRRPKVG